MYDIVSVAEAPILLRKLLKYGGSATLIVDGEWRMLWYDPRVHGARAHWPFSLAQLQQCELRVSAAREIEGLPPTPGELLRTVTFTSGEFPAAIAQFLAGAQPSRNLMISDETS